MPQCWYYLQCQSIWTSERITFMALETWDQHVLDSGFHATYQSHESSCVSTKYHLPSPPSSSLLQLMTPPLCEFCQLARSKRWVPKVDQPTKAWLDQGVESSWDAYEASNFGSADHYVVNTPGQFLLGYGREAPHNQFHGGTLFHDVATGLIWSSLSWSWQNFDGQRMLWTMAMGIGHCWNSPPSQRQWNLQCWALCWKLQEQVPDSFIFWSWYPPSECPCWAVNSNHHVQGQDLYGSCFCELKQIWSW